MKKQVDTESKILAKAVVLFYRVGFTKASVRNIAKAVGLSNATLYLYFKKKEDLLFRIIDDVGEELLENLRRVAGEHDETIERLRAMITEQVAFATHSCKRMKIYLEEQYQLPPTLRKKAYKRHRQIYDLYYQIICDLEAEGLLLDINKTVVTFNIFASTNWLYRWFKPKGPLSTEDVTQEIIKALFLGIIKQDR
ncbi:transcriptional regulator, TetR family [delta proteobacterium NaphS2]|nr:transcriptional regulator, TetR family [delta proteobacterium NaphS2]